MAVAAVIAGIGASAILLAAHIRAYMFLTDDSFISFRYARNLADGYGLVFNPGGERVEGFTNLLWVLLLAGLDAMGIAPERAANALSIAATAALFGIVVAFAWSRAPRGQEWIVLLPACFLASTRSFAVWATSGLETRLFELLLVAGLLRLVVEVEGLEHGKRPRFISAWAFGLATLTRPDGLVFAGCAFLAAAIHRARASRRIPWDYLLTWWPLAVFVVATFAFRIAYYGELVPNTYYAKVGGKFWWGRGAGYLAAFALEYGAILWIPGLVAAVLWHRSRGTLFVPLLFAAAVLPHAIYVASVGGDHFEYRPVDAYLPLIFLLIAAGAHHAASWRGGRLVVTAYASLVVFGLAWLPTLSHVDFPETYLPGYPGAYVGKVGGGDRFLDPDQDPIFGHPILRPYAIAHRDLVRDQTKYFVAIRQEEHRMFLESATKAARRLGDLVERGLLPRDVHVAMDCVGVIPYRSNVRTLDRLGLTDAHVARSPFVSETMAHGKYATREYARERGVDIWSADAVSPVCTPKSHLMESAIRQGQAGQGDYYAADVGGGNFLLCALPQGPEAASRRMPRLTFLPAGHRAIAASYVRNSVPQYMADMRAGGWVGPGRTTRLGEICLLAGEIPLAITVYEEAARTWPDYWQIHRMLAICRNIMGDSDAAQASLGRATAILRASGDTAEAERLERAFESLRRGEIPQLGAPESDPDPLSRERAP